MRKISFIDLSLIRGGAEVSIEMLFERMKDIENITLFTSSESKSFTAEEKIQKIKIDKRLLLCKKHSLYAVYSFVKILVEGMNTEMDSDIMLTNTFKSHIFGLGQKIKNKNIKWIIYERDVPENLIILFLKKAIHNLSDFVVFNSNYLKSIYGREYNTDVIYNIIEGCEYNHKKKNYKKLAFVGNLTYEKGFDRALEILAKVRERFPDAELIAAGVEGYGSVVKRKGEENVSYLGYEDRKEYLKEVGFIVLLNRRKESFSRAVAEAMMCGAIPVILKGNGMDDYADDSNSLRFDRYDTAEITESIILAIESGKIKEIAERGRESVKQLLDESESLRRIRKVFDRISP
ncbi:MAG: glycosyltransferase family 4 protein [bacterium]